MSFLDSLLGGIKAVLSGGSIQPQEPGINFTGAGVTVTDDPTNGFTTVTIGAISPGIGTYINVKDFGALGNGVHNDTTAIMAAANSLRTATGTTPGTLYFPSGTYITTGLNLDAHGGLRMIGDGALGTNGSPSQLGKTIIKASGAQSYVIRNASPNTYYEGITFHGNDTTTRTVLLVEYFSYMCDFYDCSFMHTKFDNATPAAGASLIELGGDTNLQVDSVAFWGCTIKQNPDADDVCYKSIKINQANAYRNHFIKCSISGGQYGVYITAGGAGFYKCDFEASVAHSTAHIARDYSYVIGGLSQISPTWMVDCFTETAKPWVQDINATTPNPALDQSFGELFLTDNFTSSQPNLDICLLANTHISGGFYNNISIQANSGGGGAGNAFVVAHGVAFAGGADFVGAGAATNLIEEGTILTPFPYVGTKSTRSTFRGTTDFSGGLNTSTDLIVNVPTAKTFQVEVNSSLKFEVSSSFVIFDTELFIGANRILWEATTATPLLTQDTPVSDLPTHDFSITSQAPYSLASSNKIPGNVVVTIPSPVAGGAAGKLSIKVSGTERLSVSDTLAVAAVPTVEFDTTQTVPVIKQADKTTNSGTGAALTVQAQNETGTASTGGALVLTSGTGTTAAGATILKTGGTTRLTANATGVVTVANLSTGVVHSNGSGDLTSAAVNLAGGSSEVTGTLPSGNQAAQTMGGDVSGTTAIANVVGIIGDGSTITLGIDYRRHYFRSILTTSDASTHNIWSAANTNFASFANVDVTVYFSCRDNGTAARLFAIRRAAFQTESGTITQVGTTDTIGVDKGAATAVVGLAVSGTNLVATVNSAGATILWSALIEYCYYGIA